MSYLAFKWSETNSLAAELARSITQISIGFDEHEKANRIILWRADETGLEIYSEMYDVAERVEVGVLSFRLHRQSALTGMYLEKSFNASSYTNVTTVFKLVIDVYGSTAESGIILMSTSGAELVILPADFPCFLSITGLTLPVNSTRSEYALSEYRQVTFV